MFELPPEELPLVQLPSSPPTIVPAIATSADFLTRSAVGTGYNLSGQHCTVAHGRAGSGVGGIATQRVALTSVGDDQGWP